MTDSHPPLRLSFSIPAHNEEKVIGNTLEAIRKEAASSGAVVEIVVVDNASTDRTADIAKSMAGVRVIREERKGLLFARERGRIETTGELIANIDADTRITPGWITKVLETFKNDPNLVALSGPYIYEDLSWGLRTFTYLVMRVNVILHGVGHLFTGRSAFVLGGNMIIRRKALEAVGGFNTEISFYGEDTEIAKRLSQAGKVRFSFGLPVYTSGRRFTKEGVFMTSARYAINHFWIIFFNRPFTTAHTEIRSDQHHAKK